VNELASLAPLFNRFTAALLVALLAGLIIGWLHANLRRRHEIEHLREEAATERRLCDERHAALERTFSALASQALRDSNQSFLQLAQQSLGRFHALAKGELDLKERGIEGMVRPLREALDETGPQIERLERDRRETHGKLTQQLESLARSQDALNAQTRNLVQALRRPEVRGQWGELTLRRLVELAGMVEHCDFTEQQTLATDSGRLRPDMIVQMPAGRQIVVDVKTPLDAYLSAVEAGDDPARQAHLAQHANNLRQRVRELAAKKYWEQFEQAPDFVVLFIPGDQFLAAALDQDHAILEEALRQRVILATPTSLVALLRAVAYGWRQEQLSANAERIRDLGGELYQRILTLAEQLAALGASLDKSVGSYNALVGSFEARALPGARKLAELGVGNDKTAPEPKQIETGVRKVPSAEGPRE
jgi:DNA recombination protein RmuC